VRRVTLDTNVYISALNFGGQPKRLLDMATPADFSVQLILCDFPERVDEAGEEELTGTGSIRHSLGKTAFMR